MLAGLRDRLTYANVMATIALFIALGGTGYAAAKINGKNIKNKSIAGKKLKNRTITRGKVKRNTLTGAEIAESKLGKIPNAADADNAAQADNATRADSAGIADNANLIDGIDSSELARRSDGVGFLVAASGWVPNGSSSFTSVTNGTAETTFARSTSGTDEQMRIPLSYPMRSNGRPLKLTSIRVCRQTLNAATIAGYFMTIATGDSAALEGGSLHTVPNGSGAGCDVIDVADINPQSGAFNVSGDTTLDLDVSANYTGAGSVNLGSVELTLVPG